ncbi:outer membrane protein [uncultured Sphingomonas sp.]|uniref:outer membrane protein n=1 Tax=uncultured Sphingomonas sp. TaxID=158754 RepID=UPI0035CC0492
MKNRGYALVGALAALTAAPASAQDAPASGRGVYGSIQLGAASVNDVDLAYLDEGGTFGGTGVQDRADFKVELKSAFAISGALGYDFGPVRADVEVNYSRNGVKALSLEGINGAAATLSAQDRAEVCDYLGAETCGGSGNGFDLDGGKLRQLSALANLWVDIPTGSVVTPYAGGGAGIAGYEFDGEGKARFAWQLGAGVGIDVTPSLSLTVDYRRRQTNGATITDDEFENAGIRFGKVRTNLFTAGLRFRF